MTKKQAAKGPHLTKREAREILKAHLAFEGAGGSRGQEWYAGVHHTEHGSAAPDAFGVP